MTAIELALTGVILSCAVSLLGMSVVVVNRGAGVPNFAAGAIGMLGAYIFYDMWQSDGVPWPVALWISLLVSALIGATMHLAVMRRLKRSPIASRVIATLGLMLLLVALTDQFLAPNGEVKAVPAFLPSVQVLRVGITTVNGGQIWIFSAVIATAGVLLYVQSRTTFGLATIAVCENEVVAAGMGWSPDLIAVTNWALGSSIATISIVLIAPTSGLAPSELAFLVVPALGAALIGRFDSVLLTVAGAWIIGVTESEVGLFTTAPGWAEAVPLITIVVLLLIRRPPRHDRSDAAERLPSVGRGRLGLGTFLMVPGSLVLVLAVSGSWLSSVTTTMAAAIGVLSVVVLTGYAGQLSLAQFGIAGIGAYSTALISIRIGLPLWAAIFLGVLITVPIALILAVPALRTKGATLAITSLALLVVVEDLLLDNPTTFLWLSSKQLPAFEFAGIDASPLTHPRTYAVVTLVALLATAWMVMSLRRSATGRQLLATRANPQAAASLGISPTAMRIYAFALAGAIAAFCGGLIEAQMVYPSFSLFETQQSIALVLQSVIGGVGWVSGAFVGGAGQSGGVASQILGRFVPPSNWLAVIMAAAVLVVLVDSLDGAVSKMDKTYRRATKPLAGKRRRPDQAFERSPETQPGMRRKPTRLEVRNLTVTFGLVRALDDVSLVVTPGEIVGLIGPNGAGKSTLIDAVCGSISPSSGTVTVDGASINGLSATKRAKAGLMRSFQSLELFEDMSVAENLLAASERPRALRLALDLLWAGQRRASEAAIQAVEDFELRDILSSAPRTLDHGRRRLLAIARTFAANPAVILLDEPAAGLDSRQRDELARLLRRVARDWGIGILLVEHDVDLVCRVSDRLIALVNGRITAEGQPETVRKNSDLRQAYLGFANETVASNGGIAHRR